MLWAKSFALTCLALISPVKPLMVAALVLVALDSFTGVWAAFKKGDRITSAGLRRTFSKGLIYTVGLLAGFVAEKYLLGDLLPVSKLVAGTIGVTECLSLFENLNVIYGGNLFAALVGKLGSVNDRGQGPAPAPAPQPDQPTKG